MNQVAKDIYPYFVVCLDSAGLLEVFSVIYYDPKLKLASDMVKNFQQVDPFKRFTFGLDFIGREIKIINRLREEHDGIASDYFFESFAKIVAKMIQDLSAICFSIKTQNQNLDSLKASRNTVEEFIAIASQKIAGIV